MDGEITEDTLLGGRVRLLQPANGYRAAIDPVLLAASVPAEAGQIVLDAGSGVGAASLCLAARVPQCRIIGLELQPDLLDLARRNVALNGVEARVSVLTGSLAAPPPRLAPGSYHHVMTNPPYMADGTPPPDRGKAIANMEGEVDLAAWMRACVMMLRPKGTLLVVHRADRLDGLLSALHGRAGEINIQPLWPKRGRAAKRVLVRARKAVATPLVLSPGLVLHEEDGRYTREADAVLRGADALVW